MRRSGTASKLDAFCKANGISTPQLAEAAGVSRQHTLAVRAGRSDTRIESAKKLAYGASCIVRRKVRVFELFDLDFEIQFYEVRRR